MALAEWAWIESKNYWCADFSRAGLWFQGSGGDEAGPPGAGRPLPSASHTHGAPKPKSTCRQWVGKCREMELLLPATTHYTLPKSAGVQACGVAGGGATPGLQPGACGHFFSFSCLSAGDTGNSDKYHPCSTQDQCMQPYFLDR